MACAFSRWATGLAIRRAVQTAISSRTWSPFSRNVVPVAVRSTIPSTSPVSGRELDRAVYLDDLRLTAGAPEVSGGHPRVLGRHADHSEAAHRLRGAILTRGAREDHATAPEPEIGELVHLALGLLHQHVLAGDADVRGAGLDIRGDVGWPHGHDPGLGEEQLALVGPHLSRVEPEAVEQRKRPLKEGAARDGDQQLAGDVRRGRDSCRGPSA